MIRLILISAIFCFSLHSEDLFDSYYDNKEISTIIESLDSKFLTSSILTKTKAGNPVHCLKISDSNERKPALLILGDTNPASPVGSQILLIWIKKLLANEQVLKELLKTNTLYIIPRPFPDALDSFFGDVKYESVLNTTPVDDDKDLSVNEDGFEDLNNDGFITTIRIKDENGEYSEHKDSSFLMIKNETSKEARYKIISEGIDNDKDELFNEDPAGGVNPNRNFSFEYPYFQNDAGLHQMSEEETLAISEFAFKHQEIFLVFSFGLEDNLTTTWKEDPQKKKSQVRSTIYKEDEKLFNLYLNP